MVQYVMLALCAFCFFNLTPTAEIYTLSLHDALPISNSFVQVVTAGSSPYDLAGNGVYGRSEEHTSELQSLRHLVCRLLLEKKNPDRDNRDNYNLTVYWQVIVQFLESRALISHRRDTL